MKLFRNFFRKGICVFFAAAFCAENFFAQKVTSPVFSSVRFEADSRISSQDFSSPKMDARNFAYIGLVASGADDEKIRAHLETLENLAKEFSKNLPSGFSNEEKADAALAFIYEKILSRYQLVQTRVDVAMESGVYNCVSSDVIFIYFAKTLGIPVRAVETPNHAFCTIESDGKNIDVETTNPFGVNPGRKRVSELPNGGKQYLSVPAKHYQNRHDVDDRRLLAIIYNNRIASLQKQRGANAATIGLAVDACALQANSASGVQTVAECVCNYAADLSAAGKYDDALALVLRAQEIFGANKNYSVVIESANYNILADKMETLPLEDALQELRLKREFISAQNYSKLLGYAYARAAKNFGDRHEWKNAIQIAERGLSDAPNDLNLKRAASIYKQNYAIDFHNRAAALFNAGDIEGAQKTIREGLLEIPDSQVLKNDLVKMK